ncbi:MAG TPA: caspase family protein [Chitinophagaceae bacterium]|nr:caspase family protein [Chitinophagaceae bacterium]
MKLVLLSTFLIFHLFVFSQTNSEIDFKAHFEKGTNLLLAEKYDSALYYFNLSEKIAEKQNKYSDDKYSSLNINKGICYMYLQEPDNAHYYMYKGLLNARKFKHIIPESNAILFLNNLHNTILEKNWTFNYPKMTTTFGSYIYFPILQIDSFKNSDSLKIIVAAGKYDGIANDDYKVNIYKRYDDKYKNEEDVKNSYSIGIGRVVSVENNRTIIYIKSSSTVPIEPKDLANIYCQTPVSAKKNKFVPLLDIGINLLDNTKEKLLLSRRFLLYYDDEKIHFELIKNLKVELFYVQNAYAEDTLKPNNTLAQKATEGIFKGVNIIKAFDSTNTKHIVAFINFMKAYPGKYIGNNFSFSEIYATWLLNNTPMANDDLLLYIAQTEKNKRAEIAYALKNQIKQNNIIEKWVTLTLNAFDKNDLLNVRIALMGFAAVYESEKNIDVGGWLSFLNGLFQYKTGSVSLADTALKKAEKFFTKSNNKEGLTITKKALQKIHTNNKVSLEVQLGEFASYSVAMHPSGKYYATNDANNTIRIWDLHLGKTIHTFQPQNEIVYSIAYSPNGRYFATCSDNKTIKIYSTFDYAVITTINTSNTEYCIAFSPNNKEIASGGYDSLIKVWNFITGEKLYSLNKHKGAVTQLCYVGRNEDILFSSGTDSMVYRWNLQTKHDVNWYRKKAKLLNMKVSYNGNYLFYTANDSSINVWNLYKNKFYFKEKIAVAQYGDTKFYNEPDFSPDGSLLTYANQQNSVVLVDLNTGYLKAITKTANKYAYLNTLNFTTDQMGIFATYPYISKTKLFDISGYKNIHSFNTNVELKINKQYTNPNITLQFSAKDDALFTVGERIVKFDFSNNSTHQLFYAAQAIYNTKFMINDSISFVSGSLSISLFNHLSKKTISSIELTTKDTLAQYFFNEKNNIIYLISKKGSIEGYRVNNFIIEPAIVFSATINLKENKFINLVKFYSDNNDLVISTTGKIADMYRVNLSSSKIITLPSIKKFYDFIVAKNCFYFNNNNGTITKNNVKNLKVEKTYTLTNVNDVAGFLQLSSNKKLLAAYYNETNIAVIDVEKEKLLYTIKAHDVIGMGLAFSNNSKYLATGGFDSKICLFNASTGEKLLNIFTPAGLDFVAADTTGYYMASKNSLEGLSFKLNENIYPFEQFDLEFNRPDKVLAKSGLGDTTLIAAYKKAVSKRLKKNNSSSINLSQIEQLPSLSITDNTDVSYFTNLNFTELTINCYHEKQPIKALHVLVNNNPVYGFAGKNMGNQSHDTSITIKIPLAVGKNFIKLFCTNSSGQNSLQQTFEVRCNSNADTSAKTWFIGIGVSNYKDKDMNLHYAAKDVRDLATTFTKDKNNVVVDTLIDSKVTIENILTLRKKLLTANPNDKVIIAITGHGMLDKNYDFYYGTYDIDFNNPNKRGLKYEMLEKILDSVPAQKKLLLIDACHSGALDKEELKKDSSKLFVDNTDTNKTTVVTRSTIKKKKLSKVSLNNTFELMQNLFSDFTNNNGSVVISAAGGLEFAFESATWNNGVFTYCIRKALENFEADEEGDFNSKTSISELMKYVSENVTRLTNGQQKPTSRREVLDFDWEL